MRKFKSASLIVLAVFMFFEVEGQWSYSPASNTAVCSLIEDQSYPAMTTDGNGGAIIAWQDSRSGTNSDIYAQRLNLQGIPLWTLNGVSLCTAIGDQLYCKIIADNAGGAIVTWIDNRNVIQNIYIQRIDSNGALLWGNNGMPVCTLPVGNGSIALVSDMNNGAIITWHDDRTGDYDIYAQHIDSSGNILWTVNGVGVCNSPENQVNPVVTSDAVGGAIISWIDYDSGIYRLFAQRVNSNGVILWTTNGVSVCSANIYSGDLPNIIPDSQSGAILTWTDERQAIGLWHIYAQRIDSTGNGMWQTDGVAICTAPYQQQYSKLISDGSGGAIITWEDRRNSSLGDIYVQHINASGSILWLADGMPLCTDLSYQGSPQLIADSANGAIVVWQDFRNQGHCIFANRVTSYGGILWTTNGISVSEGVGAKELMTVVSDGNNGAIVAWQDQRVYSNYDIYAQNICQLGYLGYTQPQPPLNNTPLSNLTICQGASTILYSLGQSLKWYDAAVGGTYLGYGSYFITPPLSATTTYFVQDSTCSASARTAITVIVNNPPVFSINGTATICNGDTAILSANGNFDFLWSNGMITNSIAVNPVNNTTYYVTATDSIGCLATDSFDVAVNSAPALVLGYSGPICAGDTAVITVSGASGYLWNTGDTIAMINVSPTNTTTYSVTGIGLNGCMSTAVQTVGVYPPPVINLNAQYNEVCPGQMNLLSASGQCISYTWMPGSFNGSAVFIYPDSTTVYTVSGTDINGCSSTNTITVTVNQLPVVTYTELQNQVCYSDAPMNLTPGIPANGYYTGLGVSGSTFDPSFAGLGARIITYFFTDTNGCVNSDSSVILVDPCQSIIEQPGNLFNIFPNPGNGEFILNAATQVDELDVYDNNGRLVLHVRPQSKMVKIDLRTEPDGLYLLRAVIGDSLEAKIIFVNHSLGD